jgi:hypothetical protein
MQLFWCIKTQKYVLIKFGAVNALFWCGEDIFWVRQKHSAVLFYLDLIRMNTLL